MPNLKRYMSKDDEIEDHKKNYRSAGGPKGKFLPGAPDSIRIRKITSNITGGTIVLDIGCNDGSLGSLLNDKGCVVYGVDVVGELVDIAKDRGILAEVGNAENLPFGGDKFDAVVMAEVMEHLYNPDDALREVVRVLKPNGLFLGSVPHSKGYLGEGKKADYHNWIFTKDELYQQLSRYFKHVDISPTQYSEKFCNDNNIPTEMNQWNNWVCK